MTKLVIETEQLEPYIEKFQELKQRNEHNHNYDLVMVIFLNTRIGNNYVTQDLAVRLKELGLTVLPTQIKQ